MTRKFISTIAVFVMFVGVQAASGSTKINLDGPYVGVSVTEALEMLTQGPRLMAQTTTSDGQRFHLCNSMNDETCLAAQTTIDATSYLPPCDSRITINCISSFFATSEEGVRTEGLFKKFVQDNSTYQYPGDPEINLPQGRGEGSIWSMPGVTNLSGTDNYYVGALFFSSASIDATTKKIQSRFAPYRMVTSISPVSLKTGNFGVNTPTDSSNASNDGSPNGGVGNGNNSGDSTWIDCAVTETGICYMPENFPSGYRFGITIRMGSHLTGWYHGRIFQPKINVVNQGPTDQEVTFEALPVIAPTVREKVSTSSLSAELRDYLTNNSVGNGFGYVMPESSGDESFKQMKLWLPAVKDKATTSFSYWTVKTLQSFSDSKIGQCSKSDQTLSGVVTTNALVYNAGPPSYELSTGELSYKVLSPHFTSTGGVALGTYDLILSSTVARCIYGFTQAPIQATLSILSEDGSPQVATQLINEKNGWLTLSAAGFTYSSPTVRVKLSQETPIVVPTPPAKPAVNPVTSAKKTSITCLKGKTSKKVTAFKPKCPTGFKKKA